LSLCIKIKKERNITNDNIEERKDRQKHGIQPPVFNTRGTTRYLLYQRKYQVFDFNRRVHIGYQLVIKVVETGSRKQEADA
jgi:hypothetical protein